jgi:hypothetical protein
MLINPLKMWQWQSSNKINAKLQFCLLFYKDKVVPVLK